MSTDYYVVCDKCEEAYWAWRRSAGGVNPPPIVDDIQAFQAFLDRHLRDGHSLRFVSESDDDSFSYRDVHPRTLNSEARDTVDDLNALADQYDRVAEGRGGFSCDPRLAATILRAAAAMIANR